MMTVMMTMMMMLMVLMMTMMMVMMMMLIDFRFHCYLHLKRSKGLSQGLPELRQSLPELTQTSTASEGRRSSF